MKKDIYEKYFINRNITVMGLGLLGRGLGDTQFLAEHEANLVVTDIKTEDALSSSVTALKNFPKIIYHLGGHMLSDFENKDFIMKAAGVPYDSDFIAHAKKLKIPIYMSAALITHICNKENIGVTVIGVTGTRGKTTTSQLIAYILRHAGMRVHLGGNIRGVANLPLLDSLEEGDYLVLELDSWQLQGFGDLEISPNIAVFTSFLDDHMNYYKDNKELYFNDKAQIYRHQKEYDVLIASKQASQEIVKRESVEMIIPEPSHFEMKLIGEHNQVAASLACEAAVQCGLTVTEITESIKKFPGIEGRLQDLGLFRNNIRVFNDNNATTGDATIAAIESINKTYGKKPIIILGGADKGLPLTLLEEIIMINTKDCVLLDGTGTSRLTLSKKYLFETIEECLERAFYLAEEGDIILFSPAFASFSKYFNNEYEKNDAFLEAVKKYAS